MRGELWRVLKYKCHLFGIRARQVEPRGTTHTCPHCGKPANTYRSPALHDRKKAIDWGAWLHCTACGWNGARDYAASLNIARLGMAFLTTYHETSRYQAYRMTDASVKPALYSRAGATLLLPSQGITPRPHEGKHVCYAGWSYATSLRTSHPKRCWPCFLRLNSESACSDVPGCSIECRKKKKKKKKKKRKRKEKKKTQKEKRKKEREKKRRKRSEKAKKKRKRKEREKKKKKEKKEGKKKEREKRKREGEKEKKEREKKEKRKEEKEEEEGKERKRRKKRKKEEKKERKRKRKKKEEKRKEKDDRYKEEKTERRDRDDVNC